MQIQNITWRAWLIWGIAAVYVLYQFLLQTSTSVMIPCLMQAWHIDAAAVGILSASFFYPYIILQIPTGILIDRYGVRQVLGLTIAACALCALTFSQAGHYSTATISRLLMGAFTAPAVVGALALAAQWFPAQRFALLAGLTEMLGMLGGAIGEEFLAQCVTGLGWRATMLLCAIVGFGLALMCWLWVRERQTRATDKGEFNQGDLNQSAKLWQSFQAIMRMPQAWLNGLYAGLVFAIIQAFAALWAVPYLRALLDVDLDTAATLSAMIFIGVAAGAPFFGWVSDRIGRRRPPMLLGAGAALLCMLVVIYFPPMHKSGMLLLLFALGFFCGVYVLPFAVMREINPENRCGTAMGYTNMMCILLGAPILQPWIGWLLNADSLHKFSIVQHSASIGRYQWAFMCLPICLGLAVLLACFIRETYCRRQVKQP